jgi:hypothetical protein
VSGAPASIKKLQVNAFSIVPDRKTELRVVIPEVYFYLSSLCVSEGIAQRLDGNAVNFVFGDETQASRCSHHLCSKDRGSLVGPVDRELLSDGCYGNREVGGFRL